MCHVKPTPCQVNIALALWFCWFCLQSVPDTRGLNTSIHTPGLWSRQNTAAFYSLKDPHSLPESTKHLYNIIQYWTNVEDAGPTLYKCYTNLLCLLGYTPLVLKLHDSSLGAVFYYTGSTHQGGCLWLSRMRCRLSDFPSFQILYQKRASTHNVLLASTPMSYLIGF